MIGGIDMATATLLGVLNFFATCIGFGMILLAEAEVTFQWAAPIVAAYGFMILSHAIFAREGWPRWVGFLVSLTIPVNIGVVIPEVLVTLERGIAFPYEFDDKSKDIARIVGLVCRLVATLVLVWTVALFASQGQGTLSPAPEIQTKKLIVEGPYAHVRNPMILAVVIELTGISLMQTSIPLAIFTVVFFLVKTVWFITIEEPNMLKRFGAPYKTYLNKVGRWIPSLRAFDDGSSRRVD